MDTTYRRRLLAGLALPALILSLAATAPARAAPATTVRFDIPAGSLDAALGAYAAQTHRQMLYDPPLVAGRRAPAVHGALTPDQALQQLLAGSNIVVSSQRPDVIVLKSPADVADRRASFPDPALTSAEPEGQMAVAAAPPAILDELIVTGSHIRGVKDDASPILILGRDDIDRSGRATVADALNALPQNFGGAGTPASLLAGSDRLGTNSQAANGVNLRGLGADATLVLVNGRRMAGSGLRGDFADVSALPTAAVERVDVLLDGASALYGSDAVGGVVNVILRRDFDGAETRARVGVASGDAAKETQLAQTMGKTWDTGHVLMSYEYYKRDALAAAKRDYAASDDLRPFGGTDHRSFFSHPGNILVFDAAAGAYKPASAIPAGQNGSGLTAASFLPGQVNLQSTRNGTDILPGQERNSVYLALSQELTPRVEISVDGRFSRREFDFRSAPIQTQIPITATNPHYVPIPGMTTQNIAYSFGDEVGPVLGAGSSENLGLSAGAKVGFGKTWQVEGYAAYAREVGLTGNSHFINSALLTEALGGPDNPATPFQAARDGYFNPYGAAGANSRMILDFISSGYSRTRNITRDRSANVQADGTLFALPGGDVKMALGANWRREQFAQSSDSFLSSATPRSSVPLDYRRTVTSGFAELRIPLVGPANAMPGVQRLELSLAGRVESFSDVGTTTNPKIGLVWEPDDVVRVRATYGTSFRAPSLSEVYEAPDVSATFVPHNGVRLLSVIKYGGNLDLKPETATSWTAGVDLSPHQIPGLKLSATWFRTTFSDRIGQPARTNIAATLNDPTLANFYHLVDPANPADIAAVNALITFPTYPYQGLFPASAYGAIIDARWVNTASGQVEGVDGQAAWGFDHGADHVDLSANGSYLLSYTRQLTPTSPTVDNVGQAGYPARFRGRAEAAWRRGPWGASLALNYLAAEKDAAGKLIDSWTTADLQLQWTSDQPGLLSGLSLALNVQNLADTAPPFYDSPQGVGFDASNADPLGRYVSVQLTKRW